MRPNTKLFLFTSLAFAAGVALTVTFERLYAANGFLRNTIDSAFQPPITPTKVLFVVAAVLMLSAVPLALAEWRAERRFVRMEREMRAARPADAVTQYEGPEGRGFLFDGPDGRTLLLEPAGGVGEPRVVELPSVPDGATDAAQDTAGDTMRYAAPRRHGDVPPFPQSPVIEKTNALLCLVINVFVPGLGTIAGGAMGARPLIGRGIAQFLLTLVVVGWIWGIVTGVQMLRNAAWKETSLDAAAV